MQCPLFCRIDKIIELSYILECYNFYVITPNSSKIKILAVDRNVLAEFKIAKAFFML